MLGDSWRPTGSHVSRRNCGYGIWRDDSGRYAVRLRIGRDVKFQDVGSFVDAHIIGQRFMHCFNQLANATDTDFYRS